MFNYLKVLSLVLVMFVSASIHAQEAPTVTPTKVQEGNKLNQLKKLTHSVFALQKYRTILLIQADPSTYGWGHLSESQLEALRTKYAKHMNFSLSLLPSSDLVDLHSEISHSFYTTLKNGAFDSYFESEFEMKNIRDHLVVVVEEHLGQMTAADSLALEQLDELKHYFKTVGLKASRKAILKILNQ